MGLLIDGFWRDTWYDTEKTGGALKREKFPFHDWVTSDSSSDLKAKGWTLSPLCSHACPRAHRTLIFRKLKGLQDAISVSVVSPRMGDDGWEFSDFPAVVSDSVNDTRYMHEITRSQNQTTQAA